MSVVKKLNPEQQKLAVVVAGTAVASSVVTATVMFLLRRRKPSVAAAADCGGAVAASADEPVAAVHPLKANGSAHRVDEKPKVSTDIYESEISARQYMEFHYTPTRSSYAQRLRAISESFDFPTRVALKFKEFPPQTGGENITALDIGCATGASSLEMSKYFDRVVGIDYSETFVHLAQEFVRKGGKSRSFRMEYTAPDQGDIVVERTVRVPFGTFPKRCQFFRGDAMHLLASEGNGAAVPSPASRYDDVSWYQVPCDERFDGVLAANLLCRVPDPRKLLEVFPRLLHKGGVLVLASPYSWWEGATPKSKWIGGQPGGPRSEDAVKEILSKDFELLSETDEAFLIRDHVRRYQLGFSHCTVWRRL